MKKIKLFLVLSLFTLNTVIAQNNDTKITDKKKDEKSKTLEDFIKSKGIIETVKANKIRKGVKMEPVFHI